MPTANTDNTFDNYQYFSDENTSTNAAGHRVLRRGEYTATIVEFADGVILEIRKGPEILSSESHGKSNSIDAWAARLITYFQDDERDDEMDDLVRRCSKFSGWDLRWEVQDGLLTIWDPKDWGKSALVVGRHSLSGGLTAYHGRPVHWGITPDEERVILARLS